MRPISTALKQPKPGQSFPTSDSSNSARTSRQTRTAMAPGFGPLPLQRSAGNTQATRLLIQINMLVWEIRKATRDVVTRWGRAGL